MNGRSKVGFIVLVLLIFLVSGCKSSSDFVPPAPAMPEVWQVKLDKTYNKNQREFLEVEGRLKGQIKSLRVTTYEVNGRHVQLNTIVPQSMEEGDKIFRILANRKPAWAYVRKDELLFEFVGPEGAKEDIIAAHALISQ